MTEWLDGRKVAADIRAKVALKVQALHDQKIVPSLAVIRVGEDPASAIYVAAKHKAAQEVGIRSTDYVLPADDWQMSLAQLIENLNHDPEVHAILLQLPLPHHADPFAYVNAIAPHKDVDGLGAVNAGLLALGRPQILPCTPRGCLTLLQHYQVPIAQQHVVIIGRSVLVGKPLAQLMLMHNATVTVIHSHTHNPQELARTGDILVAAAGSALLVDAAWCREGAVVVDVGITRTPEGLKGDVDTESVMGRVKFLSPVPGGVGPMTVASLLENTLACCALQHPVHPT